MASPFRSRRVFRPSAEAAEITQPYATDLCQAMPREPSMNQLPHTPNCPHRLGHHRAKTPSDNPGRDENLSRKGNVGEEEKAD